MKYKRRKDFTDEEWKRIVIEAWKLKADRGWGRVKIAKEMGISPNTISQWINRHKIPVKETEQYENGIFQCRIIDCKKIIEEEMKKGIITEEKGEEAVVELLFYYLLCLHYPRAKRIKEEGDDSHLIYA